MFGIPEPLVQIIAFIYTDREFVVQDAGVKSDLHPQCFGISQGCPLSSLLFVIVMTVLTHDAKQKLCQELGVQLSDSVAAHDLLYADNTLVIDVSGQNAQQYVNCVSDIGAEYGLSFHWRRLEVLPVQTVAAAQKPDGSYVTEKDAMVYHGSMLSTTNRTGPELGRRIGMEQFDFNTLSRVCSHASISRARRLQVFDACISSKLAYGLHAAYLNKAEGRRLDGFQARCLKRIFGIPPSFLSRVTSKFVLEQSGVQKFSAMLRRQQLQLLAAIARRGPGDILRDIVFLPGTCRLGTSDAPRRRGRPRITWAQAVFQDAISAAGGPNSLEALFQSTTAARKVWEAVVKTYCELDANS
ncbi:unnamed protein product [Polarella glacialis]|uniref:Reverse transcriptase domain-containing protein n=1 Tax=Polarella glacialis TaxID=89957 RepID=A0A813L5B1_POLGL|nr:unnamed protein product [Polarella glacialis]